MDRSYYNSNIYEENKKRLRLLFSLVPINRSMDDFEERKRLIYDLNYYEYHDADEETMVLNLSSYYWYDRFNRHLLVAIPPILRFYYNPTPPSFDDDSSTWD